MSDRVAISVHFGAEEPLVEFPGEDVTVSIPVTRVGDRLYRLDGVPIFAESAGFGDVIEADTVRESLLRFVRVAEAGGWRTFDYLVAPHKIESETGQLLLRELESRGGHWERVFGGLLFVCVPPGLDLDPTPWVEAF